MIEDLTRLQNTTSVREHTTDIILLYNKANIMWAAECFMNRFHFWSHINRSGTIDQSTIFKFVKFGGLSRQFYYYINIKKVAIYCKRSQELWSLKVCDLLMKFTQPNRLVTKDVHTRVRNHLRQQKIFQAPLLIGWDHHLLSIYLKTCLSCTLCANWKV